MRSAAEWDSAKDGQSTVSHQPLIAGWGEASLCIVELQGKLTTAVNSNEAIDVFDRREHVSDLINNFRVEG